MKLKYRSLLLMILISTFSLTDAKPVFGLEGFYSVGSDHKKDDDHDIEQGYELTPTSVNSIGQDSHSVFYQQCFGVMIPFVRSNNYDISDQLILTSRVLKLSCLMVMPIWLLTMILVTYA